jgi:hypothetical protein
MEDRMYCPKCGSQSTGDVRFCRSCGTDLGVVSQALSGQLVPPGQPPARRSTRRDRHGRPEEPPRLDAAVNTAFAGLGFLVVAFGALFFAPAGRLWWFWLLIPAFVSLGKAAGEYIRWKQIGSPSGSMQNYSQGPPQFQGQAPPQYLSPPPAAERFDTPRPFEAVAPPSVTEGTTRHLDAVERADEGEPRK